MDFYSLQNSFFVLAIFVSETWVFLFKFDKDIILYQVPFRYFKIVTMFVCLFVELCSKLFNYMKKQYFRFLFFDLSIVIFMDIFSEFLRYQMFIDYHYLWKSKNANSNANNDNSNASLSKYWIIIYWHVFPTKSTAAVRTYASDARLLVYTWIINLRISYSNI